MNGSQHKSDPDAFYKASKQIFLGKKFRTQTFKEDLHKRLDYQIATWLQQ